MLHSESNLDSELQGDRSYPDPLVHFIFLRIELWWAGELVHNWWAPAPIWGPDLITISSLMCLLPLPAAHSRGWAWTGRQQSPLLKGISQSTTAPTRELESFPSVKSLLRLLFRGLVFWGSFHPLWYSPNLPLLSERERMGMTPQTTFCCQEELQSGKDIECPVFKFPIVRFESTALG